jgi:hypothetical protein
VHSAEEHFALQERSSPTISRTRSVARDQQFVCPSFGQHVQPQQCRCDNNRVRPIHANRLHRVQTFDRLPTFLGEFQAATNVTNRTARLNAAHLVPLCDVLVVKTNRGLCENPALSQDTQRAPRQSQTNCIYGVIPLYPTTPPDTCLFARIG